MSVGLSRCQTEENSLVAPLHRDHIHADPVVDQEMDRLRQKAFRLRMSYPTKSLAEFKFIFHNVQCMRGERFNLIRNYLFYSDCYLQIFCEKFFNSTDSSDNYQLTGYQPALLTFWTNILGARSCYVFTCVGTTKVSKQVMQSRLKRLARTFLHFVTLESACLDPFNPLSVWGISCLRISRFVFTFSMEY